MPVKLRRRNWAAMRRALALLDRVTERTICVVDGEQNDG
jgi:hypothetical protein